MNTKDKYKQKRSQQCECERFAFRRIVVGAKDVPTRRLHGTGFCARLARLGVLSTEAAWRSKAGAKREEYYSNRTTTTTKIRHNKQAGKQASNSLERRRKELKMKLHFVVCLHSSERVHKRTQFNSPVGLSSKLVLSSQRRRQRRSCCSSSFQVKLHRLPPIPSSNPTTTTSTANDEVHPLTSDAPYGRLKFTSPARTL